MKTIRLNNTETEFILMVIAKYMESSKVINFDKHLAKSLTTKLTGEIVSLGEYDMVFTDDEKVTIYHNGEIAFHDYNLSDFEMTLIEWVKTKQKEG